MILQDGFILPNNLMDMEEISHTISRSSDAEDHISASLSSPHVSDDEGPDEESLEHSDTPTSRPSSKSTEEKEIISDSVTAQAAYQRNQQRWKNVR